MTSIPRPFPTEGECVSARLETADLERLLKAWLDVQEPFGDEEDPHAKEAVAKALASWGAKERELSERIVHDGIDFMASYFYGTNGMGKGVEQFLRRAAGANFSMSTETEARGYLLTLYGDISQVPYLSTQVLTDPGAAIEAIGALHKAVILQIPGLAEALQPLVQNPELDPSALDMIDPEHTLTG